MTSSTRSRRLFPHVPAIWAMLAALLLGISLTAFNGTRAYAAGNAPGAGVERAGIQVQDDGGDDGHDGNNNDHNNEGSHANDNRNDASTSNDNAKSRNGQPAVIGTDTSGVINFKPRTARGIWIVNFRPFFVDSNTTIGPGVSSLTAGDAVEVIYYTDAYGLNRTMWIGVK